MRTNLQRPLLPLAALLLVSSGCFRYVPAQIEATPIGSNVRLLVTRAGTSELSEIMELDGDAPLVSGSIVGMEGDDLVLSVPVAQVQDGFMMSNLEQRVRVPAGEIVSLERRELNGLATGATIAGAAGAVAIVIAVISDARKGENPDPPDPPDDLFGFTLLSIPFGR